MPTTFANTIDGNELYAKRAEQDKNGNQIDTTYAKTSDIPTDVVPAVTSSDDGKVLKASYSGGQGSYSWQTESGGGGSTDIFTIENFWTTADVEALSAYLYTSYHAGKSVMVYSSVENVYYNITSVTDYTGYEGHNVVDFKASAVHGYNGAIRAEEYTVYWVDGGDGNYYAQADNISIDIKHLDILVYGNFYDQYYLDRIFNRGSGLGTDTFEAGLLAIGSNDLSASDVAKLFGSNSDASDRIIMPPTQLSLDPNKQFDSYIWQLAMTGVDGNPYIIKAVCKWDSNNYNCIWSISVNAISGGSSGGLPPSTSDDAGKVLAVNSSGSPEWQAGGGGGTQVQADWNESDSSAPSYIQNKPSIPEQWSTTTTAISVSGSGESRRFNITGTEVKRYTCSSFNQGGTHSCYIKEDADAMKHDWEVLVSVSAETNNVSIKIYNSNNLLNKDYFMFTIQDIQPNMPSPTSIFIRSMTGEIKLNAYTPYSGRKVMIKKIGRTVMCLWAD